MRLLLCTGTGAVGTFTTLPELHGVVELFWYTATRLGSMR